MSLKDLSDRVDALKGKSSDDWFGFKRRPDPYDLQSGHDMDERHAWEWFCEMQLTSIELAEYMEIDIWLCDHHHPGSTYGDPDELVTKATQLRDRRKLLERVAQSRAEAVEDSNKDAWSLWKQFYLELHKQECREPTPIEEQEAHERGMRIIWEWKQKVFQSYREAYEGGLNA